MTWPSQVPPRLSFLLPALRWLNGHVSALSHSRLGRAVLPLTKWLKSVGLLSTSSRFVLTFGDEGASLVRFQGRQVVDAMFVGSEAEDGLETLRPYFLDDPQADVLVSADVLEQMYREEQLPRVGRFDRLTIVKRRLDVAFPHDRLKAAVPLERTKGGSGTVLFTALPVTENIEKWIEFLESLPNPVIGICLLPLESEGLAARLSPSAVGEERRIWHALVSQQATSGFRQIFSSDGNLVVTRMTQQPPGDLTAEAGAMLIERELRSSISYIKRLGYSDLDRLDLVVLANSEICAAVGGRELPVTTLTTLTPRRAGQILGFGEVGPEDGSYADILHAQALAMKRRPRTILPTEKMRERLTFDSIFKIGFAVAAVMTLICIFYIGALVIDGFEAVTIADTLDGAVATEIQAANLLRQRTRSYEIPIEDLVKVDQTEAAFSKIQVNPNGVLRAVALALDPATRVQKIVFSSSSPPFLPRANGVPSATPAGGAKNETDDVYDVQVTVRLTGMGGEQPDRVLTWAKDTKDRLAKNLPGHEVTLMQLPLAASRNKILEGTAGTNPAVQGTGPIVADYLIRKRA